MNIAMNSTISREAYTRLINGISDKPPEEGGILGTTGNIIEYVEFDKGKDSAKACSYSPDVSYLNEIISKWKQKGIQFCGIFHSHFFGVKTLSEGDVRYIKAIMKSMPAQIDSILFPVIVMPQKEFVMYRAYRYEDNVTIKQDKIIIR